jgi:hypothetical protein
MEVSSYHIISVTGKGQKIEIGVALPAGAYAPIFLDGGLAAAFGILVLQGGRTNR